MRTGKKSKGLTAKIITNLFGVGVSIFLAILIIATLISMKSQMLLVRDRLISASCENAGLISQIVGEYYNQTDGTAAGLRAYRMAPEAQRRDFVDQALIGLLSRNENYSAAYAYFEKGEMTLPPATPPATPVAVPPADTASSATDAAAPSESPEAATSTPTDAAAPTAPTETPPADTAGSTQPVTPETATSPDATAPAETPEAATTPETTPPTETPETATTPETTPPAETPEAATTPETTTPPVETPEAATTPETAPPAETPATAVPPVTETATATDIAYRTVINQSKDGTYTPEHSEDIFDVYGESFYTQAKNDGKTFVMEPYLDETSGKMMISIISPIYDNAGEFRGVMGVDVDLTTLQTGKFAATGYKSSHLLVLSQSGKVLIDSANNANQGKDMSALNYEGLADALTQTLALPEGTTYTNEQYLVRQDVANPLTGKEALSIMVPINKYGSRWVTQISVDNSEREASVWEDTRYLALDIVILGFILLLIMSRLVRRKITPLKEIVYGLEQLSEGNLNVKINLNTNDEFETLAETLTRTSQTLRNYVGEISEVLSEMANDNMDVTIEQEYLGDFTPIKTSIMTITESLNGALSDIKDASEQVSGGSDLVSQASQTLSQGASEQANAVEALAKTISSISEQVTDNANNAENASEMAATVGQEITDCSSKMEEMMGAMSEINKSSDSIGKIIKVIEDIAFQTNILALNAAVEASRAGVAGRGFAVVADEVRKLASQSSESASDTTKLIQSSISSVEHGMKIASETAESMGQVVNGAQTIIQKIDMISDASKQQADSILQVTRNVESISDVVQNNSATAEESAAASEELSNQAKMLMEQVGRFHIRRQAESMLMDDISDFSDSNFEFDSDMAVEQGKY